MKKVFTILKGSKVDKLRKKIYELREMGQAVYCTEPEPTPSYSEDELLVAFNPNKFRISIEYKTTKNVYEKAQKGFEWVNEGKFLEEIFEVINEKVFLRYLFKKILN